MVWDHSLVVECVLWVRFVKTNCYKPKATVKFARDSGSIPDGPLLFPV